MAFDPEQHEIDPKSGFMVHKETGHPIGLMGAPPARYPDHGAEFPKWVKPHQNHIHHAGDHISTPRFPEFHVRRHDGEVTVLVHSAEEEAHALADPNAEPSPSGMIWVAMYDIRLDEMVAREVDGTHPGVQKALENGHLKKITPEEAAKMRQYEPDLPIVV